MDLFEALFFYKKNNSRKKEKSELDIRKLQLLTVAIHSEKPQDFIDHLEEMVTGKSNKNMGLKELEKLKKLRKVPDTWG